VFRRHQLSLQVDAEALLQQILVDHEITTVEDATTSLEMLVNEYLTQDDLMQSGKSIYSPIPNDFNSASLIYRFPYCLWRILLNF
jgi:hypothetical protein